MSLSPGYILGLDIVSDWETTFTKKKAHRVMWIEHAKWKRIRLSESVQCQIAMNKFSVW